MIDWLMVGLTFVIALATVGVVFQDQLRARFWRPRLQVLPVSSKQDCHKTTALDSTDGQPRPCYYYRLRVHNDGNTAARDVEVFAKGLTQAGPDGKWTPVERFVPQWHEWSVLRNVEALKGIYLPSIPPDAARHFDLGHVIHPAYRGNFALEQDPAVDPNAAVFSLDGVVRYQRLGHLLPPGRYKVVLELAASNMRPRTFEVEVNNPGMWHDDEDAMLAHGVTVLRVS
jgi:hypothetical protein